MKEKEIREGKVMDEGVMRNQRWDEGKNEGKVQQEVQEMKRRWK